MKIKCEFIKIKFDQLKILMLDLLIILLYILVALKILLSFFSWIETRFNILGKNLIDEPSETAATEIKEQIQTVQLDPHRDQNSFKSLKEKQLAKEPQQSQLKSEKKVEPESLIKIQEPSNISSAKRYDGDMSGNQHSEIYNSFDVSRHEMSNEQNNQSILPAELKENYTQVKEENVSKSLTQQLEQSVINKNLVSVKEFEAIKRQKENAIQKMVRYVQKADKQKQLLISNHEKAIQALLNEKRNLQSEIRELKESHHRLIRQLESKHDSAISEIKTNFNTKLIEAQNLLEQSQKAHQEELQYSRATREKHSQLDQQIESTINDTNGQINSGIPQTIIDPITQAKIQQLKGELEFCQSQLLQATESQNKLKEEVEQLKSEIAQKAKAKSQISITDVINHPQYLRIKQKLQKYENGSTSSHIRSPLRSQITPRGERLSKGGVQSRISQRRSFIPSSRIHAENAENKLQVDEVFSECNFLSHESKTFLLDEIKRIKKLPIKKTKLIFRLDKLSIANPHEFIDNIPNIVLLIELTNKKVLGAFTQTAFSKEDSNSNQNTSVIARSRLGNNKSLILDLTNKMSFNNNNPNETIIYDENAIVWGKDELIIKNDEPSLLYSSFGAQDGVYSDGKYTVDDLLGGSQGFERISQYEFYRIYIG